MVNDPIGDLIARIKNAAMRKRSKVLTPASKVINQTGQWTFKYKNTNVPPAGTYGATGVAPANGRVTYSITMP